MIAWLVANLEKFTYFGVALSLFLAGLGVPIPEDIPLIFGGVMAGAGKINVWYHFGISMVFIIIGDTSLYLIGRKVGRASSGGGLVGKVLTPGRRKKVTGYYERFGAWTVFFGRFIAGVRGAIFLTAGVVEFPLWRFIVLDFLAALISVPVWIWLGWTFGENWEVILEQAKNTQGWVLGVLAIVVVLAVVVFKVRKARNAKRVAAEEDAAARQEEAARQEVALPDAPAE